MEEDVGMPISSTVAAATAADTKWLFPYYSSMEANSSESDATLNKYGFRPNTKKSMHVKKTPIAFTTLLLGAINIGLYWAYWHYRVDPSIIVSNADTTQDYGRAFSAAFGHFEIWHVGFNMMTLFTLGTVLETQLYGSIPFLMYTLAFVPLTALVVVALQRVLRIPPTSMVGFSGILFAWSVVATLSTSQTCPILFLPDLCFNTYRFWGGKLTISLGPLVQLVFLQVVLPRVSFVGHFSGIIMGFCWHWNLLPPLEWLQPCILYPTLWIIGKLILPRLSERASSSSSRSSGGGVYYFDTSGANATALRQLGWVLTATILHWFLLLWSIGPGSSIVVSEGLLLVILASLVNVHKLAIGSSIENQFGMIGRGYIVLVAVAWMTDSMTIAGWGIFRQRIPGFVLILMILRSVLWFISLCLVCHVLDVTSQTLPGSIWRHLCGSLILDPCTPIGAWLVVVANNDSSCCIAAAAAAGNAPPPLSASESRNSTRYSDQPTEVSPVV